jgi:hypothetical protein
MAKEKFCEELVRSRPDLPSEIFGILHDLAWSHIGQRDWKWESLIKRAQTELMKPATEAPNVEGGRR